VSSEESWGSSSTLHWQIYRVMLPLEQASPDKRAAGHKLDGKIWQLAKPRASLDQLAFCWNVEDELLLSCILYVRMISKSIQRLVGTQIQRTEFVIS
jgi:hypothetical protein